MRKRARFSLPQPQLSESELEEIAKVGNTVESIKETYTAGGSKATQKLLADYSKTPALTPMRTPRTSSSSDNILLEAQNLAALRTQATPLLGGANTPLNSAFGDFSGVTPRLNAQAVSNFYFNLK